MSKKNDNIEKKDSLIAIVRVRGRRNIKPKIKYSLKLLGLNRTNNGTVLHNTPSIQGILKIVKDYVTFGEITVDTFKKLIAKRAYKGSKKFSDLGEKAIEEAVKTFVEKNERTYDRIFRLHPPRKGWKNIKLPTAIGGSIGKRNDMDVIIKRMM